ncbi:MAG: PepSY-associated TM helix domain-containing protein, partial [Pseudomonadota bacterium]
MSFVTQAKTKRLLSVHGWAGTILGILVYVCIFTGSIVVFEDEIDTWSQGIVEHHETLGSNVDAHFRRHASSVDKAYQEEVSIFRISEGDIRYVFHTHEKHPETGELVDAGVQITIDPETGNVLERQEGILQDFPAPPGDALAEFWVDLHVSLYMPNPYGLILVGILGLMMMAASISGILIHKHVFRDAFIGVRDRSRLVGARDFHVLAGTWGLPFALILAFTGAFFGFAEELGIPLLAFAAFDGDQLAMIETILGHQEEADLSAAPLTNLDAIMADAAARVGSVVEFVNILHYGTASAKVSVFFVPSDGALSNTVLGYNGVTGAFLGEMPSFGQVPSVGSTLISIIAPLHFGNFAGFASKIVWLIMGIAMTYVAASGLLLWTKRREGEPLWDKFNHFISV